MKRLIASLVGLVAVMVVLSMTVTLAHSAETKWTGSSYYTFFYTNNAQLSLIQQSQWFFGTAFLTAYKKMGSRGAQGRIAVHFYQNTGLIGGYAPEGQNTIYLNAQYLVSLPAEEMGRVLCHETTHVLFANYVRSTNWNASLKPWKTFLTESLAWYAADVCYKFGPRFDYWTIRRNFSQCIRDLSMPRPLSWVETGEWYAKWNGLTSGRQHLLEWQFRAIGYFLGGGQNLQYNPYLVITLDRLRMYSANSGDGLRSSYFVFARDYFNTAFAIGYGATANADLRCGLFYDRHYLYGRFWFMFYIA